MLARGSLRHGERHPDAALLAGEERARPEARARPGLLERIAAGVDDAHAVGRGDVDGERRRDRRARGVELPPEHRGEVRAAADEVVVARAGVGERRHQVLVEVRADADGREHVLAVRRAAGAPDEPFGRIVALVREPVGDEDRAGRAAGAARPFDEVHREVEPRRDVRAAVGLNRGHGLDPAAPGAGRRRRERDRERRLVRVGDEREAVLRPELSRELAHRGPRVLDLLAHHAARAIEDDDEIGRPADGGDLAPRRGAHHELHADDAVAAAQHGGAIERAGERHGAGAGRGRGRRTGGRGGALARGAGADERGRAEERAGDDESSTWGHGSLPFSCGRCVRPSLSSVTGETRDDEAGSVKRV